MKKDNTGDLSAAKSPSAETFDGNNSDVAVDDNSEANIKGIRSETKDISDAEIINKSKAETTKGALIASGVLPDPKNVGARKPLVDAIHEEVTGEKAPAVQEKVQLTAEEQKSILDHHSQQGSIALGIINSMVGNSDVSLTALPSKLVDRAYALTDELQKALDLRYHNDLLDAYNKKNA